MMMLPPRSTIPATLSPYTSLLRSPDYTSFKPWVQLPSKCVVPTAVAESWLDSTATTGQDFAVCGGIGGILGAFLRPPIDPATGLAYDQANYPELNGGAGLKKIGRAHV